MQELTTGIPDFQLAIGTRRQYAVARQLQQGMNRALMRGLGSQQLRGSWGQLPYLQRSVRGCEQRGAAIGQRQAPLHRARSTIAHRRRIVWNALQRVLAGAAVLLQREAQSQRRQ